MLGAAGFGTANDGFGDVDLRACGWLGVGEGRLVGAAKLRNSFGTLGGATAREGLRVGAVWLGIRMRGAGLRVGAGRLGIWIRGAGLRVGAGRLGIWIRGAGLDGELGTGEGGVEGCGRLAFMRDWNISRMDFDASLDGGTAAMLPSANASKSSGNVMTAAEAHLGWICTRHMALPLVQTDVDVQAHYSDRS